MATISLTNVKAGDELRRLNRYIVLALLLLTATGLWVNWQQQQTAHNLIRLHVIAHSNNFYDQKLKGQVKDSIVSVTAADFKKAHNMAEARATADALAEKIKQTAEAEIARQGYNYPVQVVRGSFHFPTKTYTMQNQTANGAAITLPAGKYEALRVIIGDGKGSNWWCVLYPPLCFVSPGQATPPVAIPAAKAKQKDETPSTQIKSNSAKKYCTPQIEYRWRIVDIFKSRKANKTTSTL